MKMEKIVFPTHPLRCNITGPICYGKSVSQTNLV